jgi:hypothetical protein
MRAWAVPAIAVAAGVALAAAPLMGQAGGYPGGGGGGYGGGGLGPGGGRGGGRGGPRNASAEPDPHLVAMAKTIATDPENPIPLMLADRGNLKLADNQTVALSAIQSRLALANKPIRAVLDSLRPPEDSGKRPDYARMDSVARDSLVKARGAIARTMGALHDNDLSARQEALGVLNADQRAQFTELEQRVTALLRQGLPAGDGNGAGGGRKHGSGSSGPSGASG